jgi:hypothetical protein
MWCWGSCVQNTTLFSNNILSQTRICQKIATISNLALRGFILDYFYPNHKPKYSPSHLVPTAPMQDWMLTGHLGHFTSWYIQIPTVTISCCRRILTDNHSFIHRRLNWNATMLERKSIAFCLFHHELDILWQKQKPELFIFSHKLSSISNFT